jgi:LysM repeat protein
MRWRNLALASLVVNGTLAAVWVLTTRLHHAGSSTLSGGADSGTSTRTNLVLRRQFFTWQEVESSDYPTYVANLRAIGCPEQTIRDIIIADVNLLFAKRRAMELVTPEQQWWRSEPDTNVVQLALQKLRDLEDERRALLARLLGPDWESRDLLNLPRPSRPSVTLDGPILGALPMETKQAVEDVSVRSQERMQAYIDAQRREGKNPDPAELARMRQETREELQRILTPAQLEEFLLRYSQDASNLRAQLGQLRFFNATPNEFRAVFRSTDLLEEQLQLVTGTDPASVDQRKSLQAQIDSAIKTALGPQRYQEYRLLQDPLYRDAVATAQEEGTPEAVNALYQINIASAAEQARIQADPTLSPSQKSIESKSTELDQLKANAVATSQELPPQPPQPAPQTDTSKVYVLGPGDTIQTLAIMYGVPVSDIRAANPGVDLSKLKPGDSITVPRAPLPPGPR